eukprot:SAG11_NODE_5826_length_1455_cov_1.042773_1_plen_78_part_10
MSAIGTKFKNPMLQGGNSDEEDDLDDGPPKELKEVELDNDELNDLSFAFEACDLDGSGTIDVEELEAVLKVFGAKVTT